MNKDLIQRRRATRIRKVVLKVMGKFVFFPGMICGCLWMFAAVLAMHALHPDLDVNGWPFFVRVFPIWAGLLSLSLYALWAVEVHLMLRRKGVKRGVRYLFPEALSGTESSVDKIAFWALGIGSAIRQARGDSERQTSNAAAV